MTTTNKLANFTIQNIDKVPVSPQLPHKEGQTLLDRLIADINDLVKQSGGQLNTQKLKKLITDNKNSPNVHAQFMPTFDDRYVFGIATELDGKPVPSTWCKIPVSYFNKLDEQIQK
jgi:hypothetical protein